MASKTVNPREFVVFVRDPGVRSGPFRVMARTDGAIVLVDERLPIGGRTLRVFERDAAKEDARLAWASAECARMGRALSPAERKEWGP